MSATLRAAALFAIPTAVVSVLGIYWLHRRKKKDEAVLLARSLSSTKPKSTSVADCDNTNVERESKSARVVPACNEEVSPAVETITNPRCSDRKSVENSTINSPQLNKASVNSVSGSKKVVESSVGERVKSEELSDIFAACDSQRNTAVIAEDVNQTDESQEYSSLIQAVQSVQFSGNDIENRLPVDISNISTNTADNTLLLSCCSPQPTGATSHDELFSQVNTVNESNLSATLVSTNDVNKSAHLYDNSTSVLDVSLNELSNDVFAEDESLLTSVSLGYTTSCNTNSHVAETLDISRRTEDMIDKEATESGCFVSYSESVCDLDVDRTDSMNALKPHDTHKYELLEIASRLSDAVEQPKKKSQNEQCSYSEQRLPELVEPHEQPEVQTEQSQLCQAKVQTSDSQPKCEQLVELPQRQLLEQLQQPEQNPEMQLSDNKLWANNSSPLASNSSSSCCDPASENLSAVSSDSGQGGSNGHTTPPDTEAESNVCTYEFDFPSELCGMLIGRNGRHINGISRESGALISVKQKQFVAEYQTVSLQGTHKQVYGALDIIKSRFPASKFPGINFESSSPLGNPGSLDIQLSQITLPEGGFVDVVVSSVVSIDRVFLQQSLHPSFGLLSYLYECMWACYTQGQGSTLSLPQPVSANTLCVAPMYDGWFRAQVVETSEETGQCLVRFVDYGGYSSLDVKSLRQIRTDFTALPFQAIECFLNGVTSPYPEDKSSSSVLAEGKSFLENLVRSKSLLAEVVGYSSDGVPFVNLYQMYCDQMYSINEELIANSMVLQQQISSPAFSYHAPNHGISS